MALTELLAGFISERRVAGLPVSLTENLDAMAAVQHIPLEDRDAFKYALAATLVKNAAHWRVFETVFEVYFSLRGREFALTDEQMAGPVHSRIPAMAAVVFPDRDGPTSATAPRSPWSGR